jgi:heme-degrading monooxygenase HmoA
MYWPKISSNNNNMTYKTIAVFKLISDKADEEIERCKSENSLLNTLKKFPGFISYEVVKLNNDSTMTIQNWETKTHFTSAIPKAMALNKELTKDRENIVLSYEGYSGEVMLSNNIN